MNKKVIIGAGPAGLIASIVAARRGCDVILLEKNQACGRKLSITGKGRCNITNTADPEQTLANIPGNGRFMYSALSRFSQREITDFLNREAGVATKEERGGRVFPVNDDAKSVTGALVGLARRSGVTIRTGETADSILVRDGCVAAVMLKNGETIETSAAVIAAGGMSYPSTGSNGDGYRLAAALGHTIIEPKPSLAPLLSSDPFIKDLAGLSLRNVAVSLSAAEGQKPLYKDFGEMLFTHTGVSGPVILSASRHYTVGKTPEMVLAIDLKPALDEETLDNRIKRDFSLYTNKEFKNALDDLLPQKLIPVTVARSGIEPHKPVNQITRQERQALVALLKHFTVKINGIGGFREAIVTCGGVKTSEINPATMESKLVKGLFFAGEVIDVDGYTGGFNLTIAFSTGYCAGMNI